MKNVVLVACCALFAGLSLVAPTVRAQEWVEKTFTGSSKAADPAAARREIQDDAIQSITEEAARQLLGEEKFRRSLPAIQGKVMRAAGRFVPFLRPGPLTAGSEGSTMTVTLRLSLISLRQVLQEQGLLNENTAAPMVLPLVSFTDRVALATDRWWTAGDVESKSPIAGWGRAFENALEPAFRRGGFHLIRPRAQGLSATVPRILRQESPGPETLQMLGDWFGSPMVLMGQVTLSPAQGGRAEIFVRWEVRQLAGQRTVADLTRTLKVEQGQSPAAIEKKWQESLEGLASDLAGQLTEAWQKGAVGTSRLQLALQPRPSLPDIEKIKESLRVSSIGIRSIHERQISGQKLIYEVDSPVTAADLAPRLKGLNVGVGVLQVEGVDGGIISLRVAKSGGAP